MLRAPLLAWLTLGGLLGLTTLLAYVPMRGVNLAVSLLIASAKAVIIALVFMELAPATGLLKLASAAGFLWLLFMFFLMFSDYLTR